MYNHSREPFDEPVDRVRQPGGSSPLLPSPFVLEGRLAPQTPDTSSLRIPTLILYDSRMNVEVAYPTESNEAKTYRDNKPSIVRISTVDVRVSDRPLESSVGTGFIVDKDGMITTGYHVVKDAERISVTTHDGKVYTARVLNVDPAKDLALLQIEKKEAKEEFKPATLEANSDGVAKDTRLVALGFPHGISELHLSDLTVKGRLPLSRVPVNGGLIRGEDRDRSVVRSLGHVEKGNSGGPVFDPSTGKVVGIVNLSNRVDTYFNPIEDLRQFLDRTRNPVTTGNPFLLRPVESLPQIGSLRPGLSTRPADFWRTPSTSTSLELRATSPGALTLPRVPETTTPSTTPRRSLSTLIENLGR